MVRIRSYVRPVRGSRASVDSATFEFLHNITNNTSDFVVFFRFADGTPSDRFTGKPFGREQALQLITELVQVGFLSSGLRLPARSGFKTPQS